MLDQFRSRAISQLTKVISRVMPNLLRNFNATVILTFFLPLLPVRPIRLSLRLNESVVGLASVKPVIAPSFSTAPTSFYKIHHLFEPSFLL